MATPFELPIDYTFETDPAEFRTQTGDREDNTLFGDDGRDRLLGGDGDDVLFADNSRDYLEGGQGNDILYGNHGVDDWDEDRFAFGKDDGHDTVIDFVPPCIVCLLPWPPPEGTRSPPRSG